MSDSADRIQPVGVLEESPGVKSSKRHFGAYLIVLGSLLLLTLGIYSLFKQAADPETTRACGIALIIVGGSLLGITVLDGLGESIGNIIAKVRGGTQ